MKPKHYGLALAIASLPFSAQSDITFDWHGYGTIGVSQFNGQEEINGDSRLPYGNFKSYTSEKPDSKLALQGSVQFSPRFSSTAQILARGTEDYELDLEWAYLRYQLTDSLTLRAGRLRRHSYLQSDNYDVAYSYQWVRPPTTAYLTIGPIYEAFESIDLYYQGSADTFDYSAQIYAGATDGTADMFGTESDYEEHLATGVTFLFETDTSQLHLSHHRSNFDLDYPGAEDVVNVLTALGYPDIGANYNFNDLDASVYGFGLRKEFGSWGLSTEYVLSDFGEAQIPTLTGWYATLNKNIGRVGWYAGYGVQSTKVSDNLQADIDAAAQAEAGNGVQGQITAAALGIVADNLNQESDRQRIERSSIHFGMRYDFHQSAALKLEYEKLKNLLTNQSGSIYSLSLDFTF